MFASQPIYFLLALALAGFALTAFAIYLALPRLSRIALALPGARSSHKTPVPQLGGAFVLAGAFLAMGALAPSTAFAGLAIAMACALIVCIVGALDDIRRLPIALRFVLYMAVVALFVFSEGGDNRLAPQVPYAIEFVGVCLALFWFMNLTNFMDGIDGIVVAQFVPLFAFAALLGGLGLLGAAEGALGAALAGALLGFFIFNRPRARLFLGDAGSVPLGFLGGVLCYRIARDVSLFAALAPPLYFIADSSLTLCKRILRGERFWLPHRAHFYQQAFDAGQSNWSIITRVASFTLSLCALAFAAIGQDPGTLMSLGALAILTVIGLLMSLSRNS
jgi:UDP-N-acetylmuramyl pentapeptide phosphotransferase/UDP-N-acetylglucosamine-1-phosphate transferase